jgi:hypothetical protein
MARLTPWLAIVAFLTSIAYAVAPGPYTIAGFAFIGVPLYLLVIVLYLGVVIQDLRSQRVL